MNWNYVFNSAIAGLVMMGIASYATILYAQYLHPKAGMIRHATTSHFRTERRIAEIGMKGALAALQFEALDVGRDNALDLHDLCATYARINGVNFEQALAIAHLVVNASRAETKEMRKARAILSSRRMLQQGLARGRSLVDLAQAARKAKAVVRPWAESSGGVASNGPSVASNGSFAAGAPSSSTIDFGKFLSAREGGGMIPWSQFLLTAESSAEARASIAKMSAEDLALCRQAYDRAVGAKGTPLAPAGTESGPPACMKAASTFFSPPRRMDSVTVESPEGGSRSRLPPM